MISFVFKELMLLIGCVRYEADASYPDLPRVVIQLTVASITPFLHAWMRRFLMQDPHLLDLFKYMLLRCKALEPWVHYMKRSMWVFTVSALVLFVPFRFVPIFTSFISYRPELEDFEAMWLYQGSYVLRVVHIMLLWWPWLCVFQFLAILGSSFCALRMTLDAYGNAMIRQPVFDNVSALLSAWRAQNALVRSLGFETQVPFALCILTPSLVLFICMFSAASGRGDSHVIFSGGSAVLSVLLIVFFLYSASSVTIRCMRIPTLVNGLPMTSELKKMLVVQYIRNSDSGYRLFNEPVSLFFVVKVVYVLLVVLIFVGKSMIEADAIQMPSML